MKLKRFVQLSLVLGFILAVPLMISRVASAQLGTPCCTITAIDNTTGIVTGTEIATGKTFQFKQFFPGTAP